MRIVKTIKGRIKLHPALWIAFGTIISILLSVGFVEAVSRISQKISMWEGLLLLLLFLAVFLFPFSLMIYALFNSFHNRARKDLLIIIITSYLSTIFIFTGVYYSISFIGDHSDAINKFFHYREQEWDLTARRSQRVIPYKESLRAFTGIESKLWTSVDNIEPSILEETEASQRYFSAYPYHVPDASEYLQFQPKARLYVFADCLHLSVITMTTVGYGDISPKSWYAKMACDTQAISGVILFVLALGMLFGGWTVKS